MSSSRFEDHRGVIQDLITLRIDAVTEIFSRKGAIRGNHVHEYTTQYTYVVSGRLRIVTEDPEGTREDHTYGPREVATEKPGVRHAWEALEDTVVLVFARGPRAGENYESDVIRLPEAEKLL